MNQVMRTTCSAPAPASASTARVFSRHRRTWPTKSCARNVPVFSQPIWPATNTSRPSATMPFAYPLGSAQPGGCSFCISLPSKTASPRRAPPRFGSLQLSLAQPEALNLAGLRLRQLVDELDGARVLVGRDAALHEVLQLPDQALRARHPLAGDDERLDYLPTLLIGHADDGAFTDGVVLHQRRLDLGAGDVVPRGNDHVVGARLEPEVTVLVRPIRVAGDVPAVDDVLRLSRIGEVAAAGRTPHREQADLPGRQRPHIIVGDHRRIARHRLTGRSGPDGLAGGCDEDVKHVGRADAVH